MKATIYVIVILIVIVFGYFWLSNMNTATAPAPVTDQTSNSAVETPAPVDSSSTTTTVTTPTDGSQPTTKTVSNTTVTTKPVTAVKVSAAINNFSFVPQILTINAGDTVVWTNNDTVGHTVTADAGAFGSPTIGTRESFSFTFNTAGTYRYHCSIHPSMTGQVVVK